MIADLGTKPLASVRLQKLGEELGMVDMEFQNEEFGGDAEEKEEDEKKRKKEVDFTEEVKTALRLVVVAAQIRGAKGQERDQHLDDGMWVLWVILWLAGIGLWSVVRWAYIQWRGSSRRQPEEEPGLTQGEERGRVQPGLRQRVGEGRRSVSSGSEGPLVTPRGSPELTRTPQRNSPATTPVPELLEDVRMLLRRVEEHSQPGEEPGTWMEDFLAQPVVVEEVQHPEDWDPEIHGDIPAGKGSPPEAYFRRMAEKGGGKQKGSPFRGKGTGKSEDEESEEERGEGKKGGKKGRSVGSSHGVRGGAVGPMSSPSGSQASPYGRGSGRGSADDLPEGCGGKGGGWRPVVFVTPYGTKFHTQRSCRSLMNTRELVPSAWCSHCIQENDGVSSRDWAIVAAPGQTAHGDALCPRVTGRRVYRKCGLCQDLERLR